MWVQCFVRFVHGACEGWCKAVGVSSFGIILQIALHKYPVEPEFPCRSEGSRQGKRCHKSLAGALVRVAQCPLAVVHRKLRIPTKINAGPIIEAVLIEILKESLFRIGRQ